MKKIILGKFPGENSHPENSHLSNSLLENPPRKIYTWNISCNNN